jgi:propanol-preferring alcohol dehydrogenase
MGLKAIGLDIASDKLELALSAGAKKVVNALDKDAVERVLDVTGGGAHGVLVTAVSTPAFAQALKMVRRKGTVSLVGLPPGEFPTPIFDVVLKRITVRGSIVGTRRDLDEAIAFAAEGKVRAEFNRAPLADINAIFDRMKAGKIDGRTVLDFG